MVFRNCCLLFSEFVRWGAVCGEEGERDIEEPKTEDAILRNKDRSAAAESLRRAKKKRGNAELQGNEPDRDAVGFRHPFRMLLIAISFRQDWSVSAPASPNPAKRSGPPGAGSLKLDSEIKLKSL